jgi:hypothetical protein
VTHYLRFTVIQVVLIAAIVAAWLAGIAALPFHGLSAPFCIAVSAMFGLGLLCVLIKRFEDAQWITTNILFIGLLGTVVGLILAFRAVGNISSDPDAIRGAIGHVIDGMMVALFVTVFGIASRLWLKLNLWLLAHEQ